MAAAQTPEQGMDEALDAVRAALQTDARSWAAQVRTTARLAEAARAAGGADRAFVELEVAGSWSVGQATATRWLVEAEQLTTSLPQTLAALEAGELLVHQARVLLHVTRACDPGIARLVEAEVLATDDVGALCPADLRALATRVLLRLESEAVEPDLAEQRHADAAALRRTWSRPDGDGMGVAGALLTAEQLGAWSAGMDALEAQDRLTDREAGIDRTADQRRADLFAALPALVLAARAGDPLAAGASSAGVRPQVVLHVHVPMATVLGLSREPGHLDRFGPVSAEHVRLLRPVAYRRVVVDADSGRPVAVDDRLTPVPEEPQPRQQLRDALTPTVVTDAAEPQHDPSARLARLVDLRDRRCSGPGCGSTRTHRDHAEPWPAGPTAAWNLQRLSARCHRAKHAGWTVERHHDGSVTWVSPLGRTYRRPSPHVRPPEVDLFAEPPPLRPPPTPARPLTIDHFLVPARSPQPAEPPRARSPLPDDPPF